MSGPNAMRYVTRGQILQLPSGGLYQGEDLSLNREVLLFLSENNGQAPDEDYMGKIKKASSFFHEGFQHILDSSFEGKSNIVVLRHRTGTPLILELRKRVWSLPKVISMVTDLGMSMLESMEEQITGYSVSADNLWLSEDGQLSVINYWDEGEPQTQGAVGLCGLIYQLLSGTHEFPESLNTIDLELNRLALLLATPGQKEALIQAVKKVAQGHGSLSSLIFDMRALQKESRPAREHPPAAAPAAFAPHDAAPAADVAAPKESELPSRKRQAPEHAAARPVEPRREEEYQEEEKTPLIYRNWFLITSSLFIIAVLVWFLWPSQPKDVPPGALVPSSKPGQSAAPSAKQATTPNPTAAVSPSVSPQAGADQGPDTTVPNLIGMTQADAEKQAVASGLHYKYSLETNPAPKGTVFQQDLPAGSKTPKGGTITFKVSKGQ